MAKGGTFASGWIANFPSAITTFSERIRLNGGTVCKSRSSRIAVFGSVEPNFQVIVLTSERLIALKSPSGKTNSIAMAYLAKAKIATRQCRSGDIGSILSFCVEDTKRFTRKGDTGIEVVFISQLSTLDDLKDLIQSPSMWLYTAVLVRDGPLGQQIGLRSQTGQTKSPSLGKTGFSVNLIKLPTSCARKRKRTLNNRCILL